MRLMLQSDRRMCGGRRSGVFPLARLHIAEGLRDKIHQSLVTQVSGVGSFAAYDTATTGIKTFAGYTTNGAGTLAATTATSVIDVTGAITAFTTPTQSVYALRTNSNIAPASGWPRARGVAWCG